MWSRTKHLANVLTKNFYNKTNVTPIQKAEEYSFGVLKRFLLEWVIDAGVDYDEKENVKSYRFYRSAFQGHISQTVFDKDLKNQREVDTQSI